MKGYSYTNQAGFIHDCDTCKFLFAIILHTDNVENRHVADVYESCQKTGHDPGDLNLLIRFSDDGPDYFSGVNLKNLVTGYIESMGIVEE